MSQEAHPGSHEVPKVDEGALIEILSVREELVSREEAMAAYLKFVDQCEREMEEELAASDKSAAAVHRAQVRCNVKQATLLSKTATYRREGIENLYDCLEQIGDDHPDEQAEFGLGVHMAISDAEKALEPIRISDEALEQFEPDIDLTDAGDKTGRRGSPEDGPENGTEDHPA